MLRRIAGFLLLLASSLSCNRQQQSKGLARHYPVSGRVVSLNAKSQTVSLDASAIPGYMEAMTMDYPVPSRKDFDALHVGDKVKATVNVYESGDYELSSVESSSAQK